MNITELEHPQYTDNIQNWFKFRLTYIGGRQFVNYYLKKFSKREEDQDFKDRLEITPCPRFSGAAVDEVSNSIYQRLVDITRVGGTKSYKEAITGTNDGVDLLGSSMNSFIGRKILKELLVMGKVGIFIDMPIINYQPSVYEVNALGKSVRPYIYMYTAEDIRSWSLDEGANFNYYNSLLLREQQYACCPETNLPIGINEYYKYFWTQVDPITNLPVVFMQIYDSESNLVINDSTDSSGIIKLNIPKIPFICLELSKSLMTDISDYQVALLNMQSSDIAYSLKANFPFYVEQYDPRVTSPYTKSGLDNGTSKEEVDIGPASGRRYPVGTDQPAFIFPSAEPLLASMKKQEQLKQEIRLLINLAISNLQPGVSSAESKGFDERSLESGLSYIALELENAERQIGEIWSMYENSKDYPTVKYPEKYNLKSDEDRRKDAEQYDKLKASLPSKTYQKEISKIIANILLRNRSSDKTLDIIAKEIDQAVVISIPPEVIQKDIEAGLVSLETASEIRGYPPGEVELAKKDHIERISRIAIAQSKAGGVGAEINGQQLNNPDSRGVSDLSNQDTNASQEKQQSKDTTLDSTVRTKVRGKGN